MSYYIGIDLGTTNSAICSYDGQNIRIWKSPEQNDVTPSAIYVDKRGNKYYGSKAYTQAPYNPTNSATLFKRFMGTSTKIYLEAADLTLTPEDCSAEILKVLYGYLPEEIKNDPESLSFKFYQNKPVSSTLFSKKRIGFLTRNLPPKPIIKPIPI